MTAYPPERGRPGIQARLAREDPHEMTAAARSSPNHIANPARWVKAAREQHPDAAEDEITQIAAGMRTEHFRLMAQRSAQARRERDGQEMTADATNSPMHPNSPERWPLLARQQRPDATEDEITQLAAELRTAHYQRIWESRRAAHRSADGQ